MIDVEGELGVGVFGFDAFEDFVEEPDVAVGDGEFVGEGIEVAAVEGVAAVAFAEARAVVGAHADGGAFAGFAELADVVGGVLDELGIGDAVLADGALAFDEGVYFSEFGVVNLAGGFVHGDFGCGEAVSAGESHAAAAEARLPVTVGHLKMARGEGGRLRGLLGADIDGGERGDHRAERAGHEPAAAELFEEFDDTVVRAFLDAGNEHGVRGDFEGERAAHGGGREQRGEAVADVAAEENGDASGGLGFGEEIGDVGGVDGGGFEFRAGDFSRYSVSSRAASFSESFGSAGRARMAVGWRLLTRTAARSGAGGRRTRVRSVRVRGMGRRCMGERETDWEVRGNAGAEAQRLKLKGRDQTGPSTKAGRAKALFARSSAVRQRAEPGGRGERSSAGKVSPLEFSRRPCG